MADKERREHGRDRERPDEAGPSVFPREPGNRQAGQERDPEEEGSAGKTQQ